MANNSISQIIRQFLEMNQNTLESYEKVSEAITTDKQSVTVDLFDQNGNLKTVQVPAFGYLKREIERLDQNFKSLSGLSQGDAAVKMADGTFRQIQKSKLKAPAASVTSVSAPNTFTTKSNYFFESFLNPLLSIQLDVAGQVPADTEKIKIRRYIIDSTNAASTEWFDGNIKGNDNLNVVTFVSNLETNNISYIVDEEVIDAPVRSIQYSGSFDVSKVRTAQRNVVVDGTSITKTVKLYTLNKLSYSDANKNLNDTELLKVGDELMVNSGTSSTKYRVVAINTDTLEVELLLLEGYEAVKVGANQLKVYKNKEAYSNIDINIGFDERVAIFIKPVDPDSNLEAEVWSPGSAIYTNELVITLPNGAVQTLAQYYKEQVADFGQLIKALKDDSIPPATLGVTPDAPVLDSNNFKVVQINAHLTENNAFQKIKDLSSAKATAEENLKKLDADIAARRAKLAVTNFISTVSKDRESNELTAALNQRAAESKLYSSLVNEIVAVSNTASIKSIAPKFRVRGFWAIPDAKKSADTIDQEIVQFKIQYRYLSANGNPSPITQLEFSDRDKKKTAVFSNWNEMTTSVRKRVKDESTGKYYWDIENVEDGQAININQLDLAIQSGEVVEIRIKSVSEAGWPANPVESDWSDVIRIDFPEGTQATQTAISIVESNTKEVAVVKMMEELESKGLYTHLADSFNVNEKYFAHDSKSIASGFLSPEQTPITLFDKLYAMQQEIDRLKAVIEGVTGELRVRLEFEDGTTQILQNNTVNQVFAGYYTDEVKDLQIKKGHIVTKSFKLILENTKATPLELISRLSGDRLSAAYASGTMASVQDPLNSSNVFGVNPTVDGPDNNISGDNYYTTEARYDLIPVQYQNTTGAPSGDFINESPYQSGQLRGQFLYSRYKNVANTDTLYVYTDVDTSYVDGNIDYEYELYDTAGSGYTPSTGPVFFGYSGGSVQTFDLVNETGGKAIYDANILLHTDHPIIATTTTYGNVQGNGTIKMAKTAVLRASDTNGNKQMAFYYDSALGRSIKMSFEPNDQYLLGGKSCGSYLFLSPLSVNTLAVDADNKTGKKTIAGTSSVSVDIIFQYRMTDYAGTSSTGNGYLGGISSQALSNLTYSKKIGLDILDGSSNTFSIDLEVFAKYKA